MMPTSYVGNFDSFRHPEMIRDMQKGFIYSYSISGDRSYMNWEWTALEVY